MGSPRMMDLKTLLLIIVVLMSRNTLFYLTHPSFSSDTCGDSEPALLTCLSPP